MRTFAGKPTASQQNTNNESDSVRGSHPRQSVRLHSILQLQRTIGNQAVQRLLEEDAVEAPALPSVEAQSADVSHKGVAGEDEPMAAEKGVLQRSALSAGGSTVEPAIAARILEMRTPTRVHLAQRQPAPAPGPAPAPAPAPAAPAPAVAAPAGVATVSFPATLMDRVPGGWGVTTEDAPVTDVGAYTSGATWKCIVTSANQQAHQGVRLLAGVVEVTAALVAAEADCGKLKTMSKSLNSVANQGADSGFYMIAAVKAHEDLHITQFRADFAPHFTTFKTTVEGLSVPIASAADAAAAKAAILALPAFTVASATLRAGYIAANNKTAAHTLAASFNVAEHGVVDPMIATIAARRTALRAAETAERDKLKTERDALKVDQATLKAEGAALATELRAVPTGKKATPDDLAKATELKARIAQTKTDVQAKEAEIKAKQTALNAALTCPP